MSFAPPVSRDGFHYNGDLYVEVGNLNRHKRASVAEITDLLRPNLKKGNKVPGKDAFGHWYEAQLIHYGLPPTKDKARAKMRLLEALNASALAVPPTIVNLEQSLRKEYDVAERKAKALYKASTANSAEKSGSSKKRKQPDGTTSNSTTVNVNVNFGGFGGMSFVAGPGGGFPTEPFIQQQESSPPKKARTSVAKTPTKEPVASRALNTGQFATKQTARRSTGPPLKKSPVTPPTKEPVASRAINTGQFATKQTARRSAGPPLQKSPVTPRKSTGAPVKKLPVVKTQLETEKTPKRKPAIKKESAVKKRAFDQKRARYQGRARVP
ncbi:hypothetical protein MMC07_001530 [Pseudocyphellaria aurata]|nr:hypothetical protein [Pseudocyphellaria aurata]